MKRKGFLAILTAMAMIGSMGVCVYAADDAASTEDVLADYTGKADYKIGFSVLCNHERSCRRLCKTAWC